MLRTIACLIAVVFLTVHLQTTSAQTTAPAAPAATSQAKPSKVKPSVRKLEQMKAKWSANKPGFAACRKVVKQKGLAGDDRWLYIEDCMERS
jgi:hypothetical protein